MDYKEKQKHFKTLNKERGRLIFVSREKGDIKGRTYVKPKSKTEEKGGVNICK